MAPYFKAMIFAIFHATLCVGSLDAQQSKDELSGFDLQWHADCRWHGPAWVAVSPDGKTLALTIADQDKSKRLKIFDLDTGKLRAELPGYLGQLAFCPTDGNKLAVVQSHDIHSSFFIQVWDLKEAKLIKSVPHEAARRLAWSSNGKLLASAGLFDRATLIKVWDTDKWQVKKEFRAGYDAMTFVPGNATVLSCGPLDARGELKFWSIDSGEVQSNKTDIPLLGSVAVSPDGKLAAAACYLFNRYEVKMWTLPAMKEKLTIKLEEPVPGNGLAFSPDGKLLAIGTRKKPKGEPSPKSEEYLMGGRVVIWDLAARKELTSLNCRYFLRSFTWSPDGKWLVAVDHGGHLFAWVKQGK